MKMILCKEIGLFFIFEPLTRQRLHCFESRLSNLFKPVEKQREIKKLPL